ncbi:MAG: hypothetical protein QOG54_2814 [Actinomycetota bacterium]|jgi:signal transduction histidine kinase|nr:hypothetical protein [Actinomycetota bacterium]
MAERERLNPDSGEAAETARTAGFRNHKKLTLSDVDRRRTQLWSVSIFFMVAVTIAVGVYAIAGDSLPEQLRVFEDLSNWIVVVLIGGLGLAFLVYVIEKELSLRRLTKLLVEERVLSAALSNRLAEISALSELGKALNTTLDLRDVLSMILGSALDLLGGTEGSIMLMNDARTHLEVVSYRGPSVAPVVGRTEVGKGIAGTVAARREALLIRGDDVEVEGQTHPERGIKSSISVPLVRQAELLGVLNLNETEGKRTFTEHDLDALGLFAEHAAIAIGNARLFEQERETVHRLEELDRLKSDFVATVSHELKTPLTAIIGSATTLSRRGDRMNEEQRTSFVEMIERQGIRLLRLVEDILTSAQIESGMPRMRRELVDLRAATEVIMDDLGHSQVGRDRELSLQTVPDHPQVWGDLGALQQILTNLIENALKYSTDGPVRIEVREVDKATTIAVSDSGQGISKDQLGTIFDRFHQVDASLTRDSGGFGLGLYIVKSLVDAHNGEITVQSSEGVGTTFTVTLPKRSRDQGGLLSESSQSEVTGE